MLTSETLSAIAKNDNFQDKQLLTDLTELLVTRIEAAEFLQLYGEYGEAVDDLVDEVVLPELVEKVDRLRIKIEQCPYWQRNFIPLHVVGQLVHNTYFDSVKWESAKDEWKRRDAKCLSHCGYMMLFAVILLEFGLEKLTEFSLRFREHAHKRHLNDPI